MEKVQRRSLRVLCLESDFLPSLGTRNDKASSRREFEKICKDPERPCHKLLPDKLMTLMTCEETLERYQVSSSTERYKNSIIPRCCK